MRRILDARLGMPLVPVAALLMAISSGCDEGEGRSADASPIVSADSEAGKRAIAEADAFSKLRKAQEARIHARARKRHRDLPKIE
jgi:hypothetical protein